MHKNIYLNNYASIALIISAALLIFFQAGCVEHRLHISTATSSSIIVPEKTKGALLFEKGCTYLVGRKIKYSVIWPEGAAVSSDNSKQFILYKKQRYYNGRTITLQGGAISKQALENKRDKFKYVLQCPAPYFMSNDIVRTYDENK